MWQVIILTGNIKNHTKDIFFIDVSTASNIDDLQIIPLNEYIVYKLVPESCSVSNFCYCFFKADLVMQVLPQTQLNSDNQSLQKKRCLYFWQFENKIFAITNSEILNKKESINTTNKNKIIKINCSKYSSITNISIITLHIYFTII